MRNMVTLSGMRGLFTAKLLLNFLHSEDIASDSSSICSNTMSILDNN